MGGGKSKAYSLNSKIKISNPSWISNISDNETISSLSIPGTHNSCANISFWLGCGYVQCQSLSISSQLEAGIRFLDIRCRHIDKCFTMHHESFYLNKSFGEVLKDCKLFLDEYPNEFIIMTIREEYRSENTHGISFFDTFKEYLILYSDYICLLDRIPFVYEIRKKIWILQGDNVNLGTFKFKSKSLENSWKVRNKNDVKNKISKIKKNLNNSISNQTNLHITFCSAAGFMYNPLKICSTTNEIVFEYNYGCLGIVVFDFPSEDIIQHIIDLNFKK
jgi:1-phosphatidylinositol phosphodiesterase